MSTIPSASAVTADAQLPGMFGRYRDSLAAELRSAMPESPPQLYDLLKYHMGWVDSNGVPVAGAESQGKALRPTLCLFSCEALSGQWETALPAAAAMEFVHNFSLIHDDIQDGDAERRHRPTVWAVWGIPRALVAGDAMFSVADATAHRLSLQRLPASTVLGVSALILQGYLEMIEGQCLDLSFEEDVQVGVGDYLGMIALKTGALIRCSMAIGASIGSDDRAVVEAFSRSGSRLGRAFQIRDDVLGMWGEEENTGKAVGADILRKKKSYPLAYALDNASSSTRQRLIGVLQKTELLRDDVDEVLAILDEVGAQEAARDLVYRNAEQAVEELNSVALPSWATAEFLHLVDFLTSRDY